MLGVSAGFVSPAITLIHTRTGAWQPLTSLWCHRWGPSLCSSAAFSGGAGSAEGGSLLWKTTAHLHPGWFASALTAGDDAMHVSGEAEGPGSAREFPAPV